MPYVDACHSSRVHVQTVRQEDVPAHAVRAIDLDLSKVTIEQLSEVKVSRWDTPPLMDN